MPGTEVYLWNNRSKGILAICWLFFDWLMYIPFFEFKNKALYYLETKDGITMAWDVRPEGKHNWIWDASGDELVFLVLTNLVAFRSFTGFPAIAD